jgi:hypothetical protein
VKIDLPFPMIMLASWVTIRARITMFIFGSSTVTLATSGLGGMAPLLAAAARAADVTVAPPLAGAVAAAAEAEAAAAASS